MSDLAKDLKSLGLHYVAAHMSDVIDLATRQRLTPTQVIEHVLSTELKDRARRSLERRTVRAQLGRFKPISDFDWNWPRAIDRELVESALRLEFLTAPEPRNIVLVAPQGLGKTMVAQNIAHQAILAGHSVLFTSAAKMLVDLGSVQGTPHLFHQRLRKYTRVTLLAIDEVGYLSYDAKAADLLFQIVSERHEKRPLVLTTNLAFSDWPTIFPNASCTVALIDRVLHHADVLAIEGESYRRREAEARKNTRRKKTAG
jgi:DNA replication protein DnaC